MIIINGIKLGIVLAFLVGPVFFTIIQTSVEKGFWNGVLVALGVSASDTLYVTICYLGLVQIMDDAKFRTDMAYAGGGILILFGLYHLFVKSKRSINGEYHNIGEKSFYRYLFKGFIINGLSPMVLIFWIGTISIATVDFEYTKGTEFFIFFAALLGTVLITDILKAYLADKLRRLVTPRLLMIMNVALGIILIVFGGRLIFLAKTIMLI